MAWVERLASGRWRGGYRDTAKRKRYVTDGGKGFRLKSDAKAAAQAAEVKAQREAAEKTGDLSARLSWGEWWDQIEPARQSERSNTDTTERYIVRNYLRPQWGDTALNRIPQRDVQMWVDDLSHGMALGWTRKGSTPAPTYVWRIYAVFRSSMQEAVKRGVLDATPCAGVELPKARRKRRQHITVEEGQTFGLALRADYADAVAFFLETGLRPSELCGLHAAHVDRKRKVLEVSCVLVDRKRVIREWPKDRDAREVPLTDAALAILDRRLKDRDLSKGCGLRHTEGEDCSSPLVFLTERGRPMNSQVLGDRMRYAAEHHGVPRRTPYGGRRGFATRAARGGLDPFAIASVMGHSDVRQTQEYVQDERMRAELRAAFGERDPLALVEQPVVEDGEERESG